VGSQAFLWHRPHHADLHNTPHAHTATSTPRSPCLDGKGVGNGGGGGLDGLAWDAEARSRCGHGLSSWVCVDVLRFGTADTGGERGRGRQGGMEDGVIYPKEGVSWRA
jgi:hypothetical protein